MRSIWKGHIRFLLVAIPVRIYNAIETSEKIQFNQLHRDDFGPIGYDKRCKKCNEIVTNDQITKGYQYEPDRYAIVEPDDIAKIKIKTTKAVDIVGFVSREEIPSTFYDAPYFAGPDGAVSEKPYALLREVMKQTGKIAVGKVVLRDREDLVAVFPHDDGLVLQKLHYPHELRKMDDVPDLENRTTVLKLVARAGSRNVQPAIPPQRRQPEEPAIQSCPQPGHIVPSIRHARPSAVSLHNATDNSDPSRGVS